STAQIERARTVVQDGAETGAGPITVSACAAAYVAARATAPQRDGIARAQRTSEALISQNLGADRDGADGGVAGKGVEPAQSNGPARIAAETEIVSAERTHQRDIGAFGDEGRSACDIAGDRQCSCAPVADIRAR